MYLEFIKVVEQKPQNARLNNVGYFITFCNKSNKFDDTEAQMLDSIYYMTLKLIHFLEENAEILSLLWTSLYIVTK